MMALAIVAAACGDSAPSSGDAVTPILGDTVVIHSDAPLSPGAWAISPYPSVVFSGDEGAEGDAPPLTYALDATRLSDGRVVIANGGTNNLLFYSAHGDFLKKVGREGEGPGEFSRFSPTKVWRLAGDTLAAWAHSRSMVVYFDSAGDHLRDRFLRPGTGLGPGLPSAMGVLTRNRAIAQATRLYETRRVGERFTPTERYALYGEGSMEPVRIADLPGRAVVTRNISGSQTVTAVSLGSVSLLEVGRERIFYSTGRRFEIHELALTGNVIRTISRSHQPVLIDDRIRGDYVAEAAARAPDERAAREYWMRDLETSVFADTLPVIRSIKIDPAGYLWAQEFSRPGEMISTWSVFDQDGRWFTEVQTPTPVRIVEIGVDYLLGIRTDSLDVETIVLFNLQRSPR